MVFLIGLQDRIIFLRIMALSSNRATETASFTDQPVLMCRLFFFYNLLE